ncbi:17-beta-hydroxysteroid dehydrogenase type 1 isoform X1 [Lemur catta]|uniref:17-beta-hydroxysteroid dehydrogenase type 1 isoform X1 n=1 Tax=Lemur catta TaxID=9447 RepID=UPI001E26B475|nr:17-beta-hydroxysteroid dehydrogenase type 1 isoform X1 [Lemur catta]
MERTVVLITGCSSGIGRHLALRLASDPSRSFKVYATLRDLRAQGPLWEEARARGCPPDSLETLQLDVRDSDSVAAARARVTEGRVDVLVCNAGRGLLGPLEAHAAGAVSSVLDVNVAGTVRTLQAFLPDMKRRRSGRVLVTGSMGGLMGLPFNAVYCASKFALEGLCESLAVLLPPFGIHATASRSSARRRRTRRRSSSPRCAPRGQPCATSAPSASCPWRGCAWKTPAAAATWPPCNARCSPTSQPRPGPEAGGALSSALLPPPRNKGSILPCVPLPPLRPRAVKSPGTGRGWQLHCAGACSGWKGDLERSH